MNQDPGPPIVEAAAVTKVFRDFWRRPKVAAVSELDFEVRPGEVFGLLGPNGSGKSTTLKMILGLLVPSGGVLRVLGQSPRQVRIKQEIGYLPEECCLYPQLTCAETLHFLGRLFDLSTSERTRRVDQLFELVGLGHARKRMVGELSKGMARRIGLAQALINNPRLLVLDEPTSGLDPLGARQVKDLITKLAARGKTVLLSSHLLADVEDVCDRILILYHGRAQAQGPIDELLAERRRLRIDVTDLPPKPREEILAALQSLPGGHPVIEHPRMSLEQYFLDVVAKVRPENEPANGLWADHDPAPFLSAPPADAGGESGIHPPPGDGPP